MSALRRVARDAQGFGIVELLIALGVLNIALFAVIGAFNSGMLALRRASQTGTASALADKQMELYRQAAFTSLSPGALSGGTQTGSDGRTYWVGKTISWTCVVGPANTTTSATPPACTGTPASRAVKLVAVEVHRGSTSAGQLLFSESATFDSSTD